MKRIFILIPAVVFLTGCSFLIGEYNSRNLFDLVGKDMTFTQGFISVKNVDRVVILRETNTGSKKAPKPLPPWDMDYCPVEEAPVEKDLVSTLLNDSEKK